MTRQESIEKLEQALEDFKTLTKANDVLAGEALYRTKPPLNNTVDTFAFMPKCFASLRWNANRYIEHYQSIIDYIKEHSK